MNRRMAPALIGAGLVALLFLVGSAVVDGFSTWYGISATLTLATFTGIAAAGQTTVIMLRGLDLSVPAMIGLGNVVTAELTDRGWPFSSSVIAVVALAALAGACSGLLSAWLPVDSIIPTLGMGVLIQGAYQAWTGGMAAGTAPDWLISATAPGSTTGPLPLAPIVIFWTGFAALFIVILRRTVYGRALYATGANPAAAARSLINPVAIWTITFAASAGLAALTGVLLLGFTAGAQYDVGEPYLFLSIGAVAVGGTSFLGGRGGYGATVIGALILTELTTILLSIGSSQAVEQTVLGVVIVLVVAAYAREPHVRTRV